MLHAVRLCFLLFFTFTAFLAAALPIVWSKQTPSSSNAQLIRDTSGNLYFVTRTAALTGRQLNLTKYNPLGTALWTQTYAVAGNLDVQFAVHSLGLTSNLLLVVAHERDGGGTGTISQSRLLSFDRFTGAPGASLASGSEFGNVAVGNGQFAMAEKNVSNGNGFLVMYNDAFQTLATIPIGQPWRLGHLAMDSTNTAYLVLPTFQMNAELRLYRCSVALGIEYQSSLDAPGYWAEVPFRTVHDPSANRIYALAQGTRDGFADPDTLLYVADATSGAQVHAGPVFSSANGTDMADELIVLPGGVAASAFEVFANQLVMRRFDPAGGLVWTRIISNVPSGQKRSIALDSDNNLLVLTPASDPNIRISRIHAANGDDLGTLELPVGTSRGPIQLVTDAAGNMFVNTNGNGSANLLRVQPAQLGFSANNVVGGASVNGQIDLAAAAASDQTWTLASSNASVVSVPPSVVVSSGNSSATFPLTINGVSSVTSVTINARHNGYITQRAITVIPSRIQSVTITPQVVIGGGSTTAILNLLGTAPVGGLTMALASSKPAVASVPATAQMPQGQSMLGVMVTTFGVNSNQGVVITATTGAVSKTAFFAVNAPSLTSISVFPTSLQGGQIGTLTLNINGIAPAGGFSIVLISGAPSVVFLSASSSIPAGQLTHNLNVPTAAVTTSLPVTVFATRAGIYRTATLTVTP